MPNKKHSKLKRSERERLTRQKEVMESDVVMALLSLFSVVDDVFTEEGAFSPLHIKKSLGRVYREWKKCRVVLDPKFDPKRYPKRQRPPAKDRKTSSSGQKTTSGRSPSKKGKRGKR